VFDALEIVEAGVLPAVFLDSSGDGGELLLHTYAFHFPLFFIGLADYHVGVVLVDFLDALQQSKLGYMLLVAIVVLQLFAALEQHRPLELQRLLDVVIRLIVVLHQQVFIHLEFLILLFDAVDSVHCCRLLRLLELEVESDELTVE